MMSRKRKWRSVAKQRKKVVTPYKQKNDKPNLVHRFFMFMVYSMIRLALKEMIKPFVPEPLLSMLEDFVERFFK